MTMAGGDVDFDTADSLPGFDLNTDVAGAEVRHADEYGAPSPGTFLNEVTPGTQDFASGIPPISALDFFTKNNGFEGKLQEQFHHDLDMQSGRDPAWSGSGGSRNDWASLYPPTNPYNTDSDNMIGRYPMPPDQMDNTVSNSLNSALDSAIEWWSRDPSETSPGEAGIWEGVEGVNTHQDILDQQAQALAQGGQGLWSRISEGDIFWGYQTSGEGPVLYESMDDAMYVANQMRARGSTPHGFRMETGIWDEMNMEGVESKGHDEMQAFNNMMEQNENMM